MPASSSHMCSAPVPCSDAGILFYSSNLNLDWKSIMKTVTADLEGFLNLGGWSHFLGEGKEDEEGDAVEMSALGGFFFRAKYRKVRGGRRG